MVGKILDRRYVVLESVGPDGAGFRYLVYDMNSMNRAQMRVDPDEDGTLTGRHYTLVEAGTPLASASAAAPAPSSPEKPPIASAPTGPVPARPMPLTSAPGQPRTTSPAIRVLSGGAPPRPTRPRLPTPRGFQPTGSSPPGVKDTTEDLASLITKARSVNEAPAAPTPPAPAPLPPPASPVTLLTAPKLAPERALADALARALEPPPSETTQPIDLASAEELLEAGPAAATTAPAPAPAPQGRPRIQTKVLEAAWFAQGDQLDETTEEPEELAIPSQNQEELLRHAEQLTTDQYRRYALELSPPIPPPIKIVEAFLEAKPDLSAVAPELSPTRAGAFDETLASLSQSSPVLPAPSNLPTRPTPPLVVPASPANPAPPASTPPTSTLPGSPSVGISSAPQRAVSPVATPAPQRAASPLAPVATPAPLPPQASPPVQPHALPPPALQPFRLAPAPAPAPTPAPPFPLAPVATPAPSFAAATPAPTTPFQLPAPAASLPPSLPPEPPPVFAPASIPAPPLVPAAPAVSVPVWAGSAGTVAPAASGFEALLHRLIGDRLRTFFLGLALGGIVSTVMTLALSPSPPPVAVPTACPKPSAVTTADPKPTAPALTPAPPTKTPVAAPAPAPAPPSPPEPAPAASPEEPRQLSAKERERVRVYLVNARKAARARHWRRAHHFASQVLRLQPENQQAARLQAIAAAKL